MQNNNNRLKILGLTGGIASGKSTAAVFLRERGGYVIDADSLSHSVIQKGQEAYHKITTQIKGDYLQEDGEINRARLGEIVFSDDRKLRLLESIVHGEIKKRIANKISELNENPGQYKFIVVDAPLLLESSMGKGCDSIWVVLADAKIRKKRLMKRNNLTKEQSSQRINIQRDWDSVSGDYVFIDNNGSVEELFVQLENNLKAIEF